MHPSTAAKPPLPPAHPLTGNPLESLLLGAAAAAVAKTAVSPIERVKLLLTNGTPPGQPPYRGIVDVWRRAPRDHGVLIFWRGNFHNVCRYAPSQAVNFALKDFYRSRLDALQLPRSDRFARSLLLNSACGGAAALSHLAIVYPMDAAQSRRAIASWARISGPANQVAAKAAAEASKAGIYQGFAVPCAGAVVYRAAYFGLFDTLTECESMRGAGLLSKFGVAYCVTVGAGLLAYPLDTVRRRMHMTVGGRDSGKYTGGIDCARKIVASEGVKALYKGGASNVLRGFSGALMLVAFDAFKRMYLARKQAAAV